MSEGSPRTARVRSSSEATSWPINLESAAGDLYAAAQAVVNDPDVRFLLDKFGGSDDQRLPLMLDIKALRALRAAVIKAEGGA